MLLLPVAAWSMVLRGGGSAGGGSPTSVERTGSVVHFGSSADSGTQSITAPSDAEFMVVFISGYPGGSTCRAGGAALTYNSVSMTASFVTPKAGTAECDATRQTVAIHTLDAPATGSNTLAWNLGDTGDATEGLNYNVAFYKGVSGTPVKATGGQASYDADTDITSGALTTEASKDLVVCVADAYTGGDTAMSAGVTSVATDTYNSNTYRFAEGVPSGSSTTITYNQSDQYSAMGCIVIDN